MCEEAHRRCLADRIPGMMDQFCIPCKDGKYYKWSHPLSPIQYCLDPDTGKEIPGTRRSAGQELLCPSEEVRPYISWDEANRRVGW